MLSIWRTIVAVAALLAPLAASASEAAAATLSVTTQPKEMRLAEGGRARVRVAAGELPVLTVSAGRLEGLREVGSGLYEAEYIPPDSVDPLVAIVTASAQGRFAWTSIALAGVREVVVKAPHRTLVSVRVAGDVFGPIPADGTGRAVLRVDVPPGETSATANGNRIVLPVPRRAFSHVALERDALDANSTEAVKVRVVALGERGEPLRRPDVKLQVSEGSVGKLAPAGAGVVETTWQVGPGRVREATITAKVGSRPPSSATAALRRIAGEPVAVHVDVDRDELVAGDGDELAVTSRIVDAAGNPTDVPANLFVTIRSGAAARLVQDAVLDWQQEGGVYTGRVLVPRQRSGTQQLELRVVAQGGLVGTRSVALVPGPAAAVRVQPDDHLYADGRKHQLRVVLLDKYGNYTDGQGEARVTATHGIVGAPARAGPGVYVVDYRSPLSSSDYSDVIRARVGPLEGQTELRVRARSGAVVLGAKGGYTLASGGLGSPTGALEVGLWRRALSSSLGVVIDLSYFSFGQDETLTAGELTLPVDSDASFLGLGASVAWRRPLLDGMFWAMAGPGIARSVATVRAPGQPDLTSTSWVPTASASVAWGLPLGHGIPFAELKAGWQGEASDAPVRGSVETLTFALGYRFDVL